MMQKGQDEENQRTGGQSTVSVGVDHLEEIVDLVLGDGGLGEEGVQRFNANAELLRVDRAGVVGVDLLEYVVELGAEMRDRIHCRIRRGG